ncbi:MAG: methyltransferase domain-containing protein [Candidatus Hermodarchaeota archaeon]
MADNGFKLDPKKRFSSRVENYIKYRPKYPYEVTTFLKKKKILTRNSVIADIGSGTGILSELFLKEGNRVYGIEPNKDMRSAAETLLRKYSQFISIEGSAENTTLEPNIIDIITVGQAFHWFDLEKAKIEFLHILKPNGWVILIWNRRRKLNNKFLEEYEVLLLNYGTDYKAIEKKKLDYDKFFGENKSKIIYKKETFYNVQILDFEGLKGRLLSTSYIPLDDHPNYNKMMLDLRKIFNKYEINGFIQFEYDTEVFYGQLK